MLVAILVFFIVLESAEGRHQTCLSCQGIPRARDCQVIAHCGQHEKCYIDQHVTATGQIVFDLGCRDTLHCATTNGKRSSVDNEHTNDTTHRYRGDSSNVEHLDGIGGSLSVERHIRDTTKICTHCCGGNLCNSHGCGQHGYGSHAHRGPICMSCAQQSQLSNCNQIKQCGRDEACYLQEAYNGLDLIYTTGCKGKATCESRGLLNLTHVVGREIPGIDVTDYPNKNTRTTTPYGQRLKLLNKNEHEEDNTSELETKTSQKRKKNSKTKLKNILIDEIPKATNGTESKTAKIVNRAAVDTLPETIVVNMDLTEDEDAVQHIGTKTAKVKANSLTVEVDELVDDSMSEDTASNIHCASCCLGDVCIRHPCNVKVNGRWSNWTHWSTCSATCSDVPNRVTSFRTRSCSNPSPQNGGNMCTGDVVEHKNCTMPKCPGASGSGMARTPATGTAQSMICLSCSGAAAPRDCNMVEICGPNSVCYVDMHITTLGYVSFYSGCRDKSFCQTITRRDTPDTRDTFNKDTVVCQECCSGNLCNNKGCNKAGYPSTIGPICYSCDQQSAPNKCNTITICEKYEACHLSYYSHVDTVFATGCKNKTECQGYLNTGPVYRTMIGRDLDTDRQSLDLEGRGLDINRRSYTPCQKCCTSDLCNNDTCTNAVLLTTTMGPPIDGQWSGFQGWSQCSADKVNTTGHQSRTRTCTNPAPQNGGRDCVGFEGKEMQWCDYVCHDPVITGIYLTMGAWTTGGSVLLNCHATSIDGEAHIAWLAPISTGVTNMEDGQLYVTNIRATQAGVYTCTAQNDCGHVSKDYTAVVV